MRHPFMRVGHNSVNDIKAGSSQVECQNLCSIELDQDWNSFVKTIVKSRL
jgi:hypothetical protein